MIANEALKMCRKAVGPYLACISNACLHLGYCPDRFNEAITIAILKPGKAPVRPKSYRPIALLNTTGKLLEKVVANRIKTLLAQNPKLIPSTQFGALGKDTTKALQRLTSIIYRGWRTKQRVTLLGLNMGGAIDSVDGTILLQRLKEKRMPDWILKFVCSFLSDRRTTIRLPGLDTGQMF